MRSGSRGWCAGCGGGSSCRGSVHHLRRARGLALVAVAGLLAVLAPATFVPARRSPEVIPLLAGLSIPAAFPVTEAGAADQYIKMQDVRSFSDLQMMEFCPVANCPGLDAVPPIDVFGYQISYRNAALAGAILSFGWKIAGIAVGKSRQSEREAA
mmetsp:Transcript_1169/g.2930  ORF Transcript_1169/g.2930 Transcript_1169/m.2930 type:complete len:155 (+) Transcript_1169:76-540(+)